MKLSMQMMYHVVNVPKFSTSDKCKCNSRITQ